MGKIMKNGRSYSGWGGDDETTVVANPEDTATDTLNKLQVGNEIYSIPSGGGGASGPVTWVETQETTPAYPYRKYVTDVVETTTGQTTITPTYMFTDPDSSDTKYIHPSIVADYSLYGLTQIKDNIYFTDYVALGETSGTAHPTVTVNSVTFDDPNVESYSSFDLVNPQIYNGYIYAFLPQTIEFVYNQHSVTATFSGEFLRTQVGTYQHTQTATRYTLGIAQS